MPELGVPCGTEQGQVQTQLNTSVKESGQPHPKMQTVAPCVLCLTGQCPSCRLAQLGGVGKELVGQEGLGMVQGLWVVSTEPL